MLNLAHCPRVMVPGQGGHKRPEEGKDYQASCRAYQKGPEGLLAGPLYQLPLLRRRDEAWQGVTAT